LEIKIYLGQNEKCGGMLIKYESIPIKILCETPTLTRSTVSLSHPKNVKTFNTFFSFSCNRKKRKKKTRLHATFNMNRY